MFILQGSCETTDTLCNRQLTADKNSLTATSQTAYVVTAVSFKTICYCFYFFSILCKTAILISQFECTVQLYTVVHQYTDQTFCTLYNPSELDWVYVAVQYTTFLYRLAQLVQVDRAVQYTGDKLEKKNKNGTSNGKFFNHFFSVKKLFSPIQWEKNLKKVALCPKIFYSTSREKIIS